MHLDNDGYVTNIDFVEIEQKLLTLLKKYSGLLETVIDSIPDDHWLLFRDTQKLFARMRYKDRKFVCDRLMESLNNE